MVELSPSSSLPREKKTDDLFRINTDSTERVHFHYLVPKIISTVFVYFWDFFARKITLFR